MPPRATPQAGPSAVYPIIEKFINDEYAKLDSAQITPWAFFHSGAMKVNRFVGDPIAYSGIRFSGSPTQVFWNGYIEPFLKDIAFRAIDRTMVAARDRSMDLRQPLAEVRGQLYGLCRRTFDRMANIDRNLRTADAAGAEVPLRHTARELDNMHRFIDSRIDAELKALPAEKQRNLINRLNLWHRDNPIVIWAVTLAFAILGAYKIIVGFF